MRKKIELAVLLLFLAVLVLLSKNLQKLVSSGNVTAKNKIIVLDSGHGGDDPGKIGVNQAKEKDVNLEIARKIKKRLEKKGWEVVMTREKDEMLGDPQAGNKKIHDMKARVEIINKTMPQAAVSIHQNSYQDEQIRGAQVFYYSHSEEGKRMAEQMQKALLTVDETNTRQAKANDTYYLLKRTEVPTIIVECGFLSNPEEPKKVTEHKEINDEGQTVTIKEVPETPTPETPGTTTKTSNPPKTEDTANAILWIAILVLSAAGITGVRIWNKKKQVKRLGIEEKKEEEE